MNTFNRVSVVCKLLKHESIIVGISFTPQRGMQAVYFCNELAIMVNGSSEDSTVHFEFDGEHFLFYVEKGWGVGLEVSKAQGNQLLKVLTNKKLRALRSNNGMQAELRLILDGVSDEVKLVTLSVL